MKHLHVNLMWSREDGWSFCFANCTPTDEPRVSYWLRLASREEVQAILKRYLCGGRDMGEFAAMDDHSGHMTIDVFVGPRRLAALVEATRKNPQSGYDLRVAAKAAILQR